MKQWHKQYFSGLELCDGSTLSYSVCGLYIAEFFVVVVFVVTQISDVLNERHKYVLKSWKHLHTHRSNLASLRKHLLRLLLEVAKVFLSTSVSEMPGGLYPGC